MLPATLLALGFAQLAVSAESSSTSLSTSAPRVDTGYAIFVGNHSLSNTAAFLGIPYAEPPVGEGRFRAPAPLNVERLRQNKSVVDASQYPDFCVQGTTGNGDAGMSYCGLSRGCHDLLTIDVGGAGSEDCLKVEWIC